MFNHHSIYQREQLAVATRGKESIAGEILRIIPASNKALPDTVHADQIDLSATHRIHLGISVRVKSTSTHFHAEPEMVLTVEQKETSVLRYIPVLKNYFGEDRSHATASNLSTTP